MKEELHKLEDIINSKIEEISLLIRKNPHSNNYMFYQYDACKTVLEWVLKKIKEVSPNE